MSECSFPRVPHLDKSAECGFCVTIHWFCQGSAVGGTLQLAGNVLNPPLQSQGPYSPFEAEREVKAGLSFPSPPANPALVGTCPQCWEYAGRKGASGMRMGRQRCGALHPLSLKCPTEPLPFAVIWHGSWTVPPCPVPKEALGNLSGHFHLLSWCLLSALQTLCVKG